MAMDQNLMDVDDVDAPHLRAIMGFDPSWLF